MAEADDADDLLRSRSTQFEEVVFEVDQAYCCKAPCTLEINFERKIWKFLAESGVISDVYITSVKGFQTTNICLLCGDQ